MRIDAHTHIWEGQEAGIPRMIAEMDKCGIDRAVVLPIEGLAGNEFVARCVKSFPDRLVGFASVRPHGETVNRGEVRYSDPIDNLNYAIEELGLRGLKLHPGIQAFYPNSPELSPLMATACKLGIPVLFHTGPSFGRASRVEFAMLHHFDDLAIAFPELRIILAHAEIVYIGPMLALKHPNVYLETSWSWKHFSSFMPGIGKAALKICESKKVIFGTDANPEKAYRFAEELRVIEELDVPDEDKNRILGANMMRVLGEPLP